MYFTLTVKTDKDGIPFIETAEALPPGATITVTGSEGSDTEDPWGALIFYNDVIIDTGAVHGKRAVKKQ